MEKAQKKAKDLLKDYVFDGVLLILLGLAIFIWPKETLHFLFLAVGVLFALVGIVKIFLYYRTEKEERRGGDLFFAILTVCFGIAVAIAAEFFITLFQIVTGVLLLYGALILFLRAYALRRAIGPMFVTALIFALLITALAIVILLDPVAFASFITQLHGVSLILEGLSMIVVLRSTDPKRKKAAPEAGSDPGNGAEQ